MTASLHNVTLDAKYQSGARKIYLSGTQALVRLLLVQRWRDRARSIATGGFVSGYRGSPLGGFDRELWKAQGALRADDIRFWPAVNEDLAATAVWGTQMIGYHGRPTVAGVFGMWYGKGAGLDRSGDAIRHAAAAGVSRSGGVLAVVGDDHAQKSSTQPYYCEPTCADLLIPVLSPASITELLEFGIKGWALSRFSGAWVALKTTAELLDCSASIEDASPDIALHDPPDFPAPPNVHLKWPDPWPEAEVRWIRQKLPAIHAYARANSFDRVTLASARPELGIITAGKTDRDLRQALRDMGLRDDDAAARGITIYKVGMTWPLEIEQLKRFARGLKEILVIEEKRPIIEDQLRSALFDWVDRPIVTGKKDHAGEWQFPWIGELGPDRIVRVLARKLGFTRLPQATRERLSALDQQERALSLARPRVARPPYFCSGCPHSTSTKVPDGSIAIAGVGCHYMAVDMDRNTTTFSHMGGEGATWIGEAPFSDAKHVFVNLGEGTYFHSGSLAVRACIAAGINVTYKILYNDAVAMTGGQPVDGPLSVERLAEQLHAEGIRDIRIVAEDPGRFADGAALPPGTTVHRRTELESVQKKLRETAGVTALIYDQTCAAEKRRRRKRRELPEPSRRVFINAAVCEACGDCSQTSNCLSVVPVETELGRKRQIDQSSCNKDYSCVEGFCPSFVTVEGVKPRRQRISVEVATGIPQPAQAEIDDCYDIFITGVGGTGIVTIGALIGMAAHLEGKACSILDQLGMAQKGGAVVTHVRLGHSDNHIPAARVRTAGADLLLALDLPVALQDQAFSKLAPNRTRAIVNTHETITGAFTRSPDQAQPIGEMLAALAGRIASDCLDAFDANRVATALTGDSIATSVFVLGVAFQHGWLPLSHGALVEAIRLNGVAVDANLETFEHGRRFVADRAAFERVLTTDERSPTSLSIDALIAKRTEFLARYQNAEYARKYADFVRSVVRQETVLDGESTELTRAVAESLFKLMAYKDEYEVARLYTDGEFSRALRHVFEGRARLTYHLAPPIFAFRDRSTGQPRKRAFGPWLYPALVLLARLRFLRGTPLDVFGYTRERRLERHLIAEYRARVDRLLQNLSPTNHALAVRVASVPLSIRGFGHVKLRNIRAAEASYEQSMREFTGSL